MGGRAHRAAHGAASSRRVGGRDTKHLVHVTQEGGGLPYLRSRGAPVAALGYVPASDVVVRSDPARLMREAWRHDGVGGLSGRGFAFHAVVRATGD